MIEFTVNNKEDILVNLYLKNLGEISKFNKKIGIIEKELTKNKILFRLIIKSNEEIQHILTDLNPNWTTKYHELLAKTPSK